MADHSLEKPSFVTAGALFGVWGVGVAVTQLFPLPLFWAGITICLACAGFTVWRYSDGILGMFRRSPNAALPLWEAAAVAMLLSVEIAGAMFLGTPVAVREVRNAFAMAQPSNVQSPLTSRPRNVPAKKRTPTLMASAPQPSTKIFLHMTFSEFEKIFVGKTSVQTSALMKVYEGKWIPLSGTVTNVDGPVANDTYLVSLEFGKEKNVWRDGQVLMFNTDVSDFTIGQKIYALCQIYGQDKLGSRYFLSNCELTSSD